MKYRIFGKTGLKVSEIGIGGSHFGSMIEQKDSKEIAKTLLQALDSGVNFYDTADIYGQGESEKLIGRTFKNRREQVIIASKAGFCLSTTVSMAARIKPLIKPLFRLAKPMKKSLLQARSTQTSQNFSASYLTQAVEASLKRLQTDYLDIFQLHEPPSLILKSDETISALEKLKSQGKIRYYGAACSTIDDALICLENPGFSSVQVEINIINQSAITKLLPLVKQKNIGVIARQPFASGLIFKSLQESKSAQQATNELDCQSEIQDKLKKLNLLISQNGPDSITSIALQFLLQYEDISVVVAGMRSLKHLEQNLAGLSDPRFTAEALAVLS